MRLPVSSLLVTAAAACLTPSIAAATPPPDEPSLFAAFPAWGGPPELIIGSLETYLGIPTGMELPAGDAVRFYSIDVNATRYLAFFDADTTMAAPDAEVAVRTAVEQTGALPTGEEVPMDFAGTPVETVWFATDAGHRIGYTIVPEDPAWYEISVEGPATAETLDRFSGWWGDLPIPSGATPVSVRIGPADDGFAVGTTLNVAGDLAATEAAFVAALDVSGWSVDAPGIDPATHAFTVSNGTRTIRVAMWAAAAAGTTDVFLATPLVEAAGPESLAAKVRSGGPVDTSPPPVPMTADQVVSTLSGFVGPTDDLAAELTPLLPVPTGVPTPPATRAIGWSVYHQGDAWDAALRAVSDTPPHEVADLYVTTLGGAGVTVLSDSTADGGDAMVRTIEFDLAGLSLTVTDTVPTHFTLQFVAPTTADSAAALAGWFPDLPLPAGGDLVSASTNTSAVNDVVGVFVTAELLIDGARNEVEASFITAQPGSPYQLDPTMSALEHQHFLVGPGPIADIEVSFYDGPTPDTTDVWVSGYFEVAL